MKTFLRSLVVLTTSAVLAASASGAAEASPNQVPPAPDRICPSIETYRAALADIHAAERRATSLAMRRTLHMELVQLIRDVSLESSTC